MNSAKTKHCMNLRTAFFPSLHSTPSVYSMLRASVWSIICKWLIAVVPLYLACSQQAGFKENITGQDMHEKACAVNQKEKATSPEVFFNITYCTSRHVAAPSLSVSLAYRRHVLQPSSFILQLFSLSASFASHPLCCPFASILLNGETLFVSLCGRSVLRHRWLSSSGTHDDKREREMREKWKRNSLDKQNLHLASGCK